MTGQTRRSRFPRGRSFRCPAQRRTVRRRNQVLKPVNLLLPRGCCEGWFFEHTDECPTPHLPRACSACAAEPGTEHSYDCQWWWN